MSVSTFPQHFKEKGIFGDYFGKIFEKINIWGKWLLLDLFEKISFCPYHQKYQLFEEKVLIFKSFWKICFCLYLCKFLNFEERTIFGDPFKKFVFCPYLLNLNISRKRMLFWEPFKKKKKKIKTQSQHFDQKCIF